MESIRHHRGLVLSLSKGFTLVELMVVLAIIVIITSVVLTSQSSFNKTLILSNTAYDIALTLRSVETYGLGSRALGTTVNAGYGLHFDGGTSGSFILFADTWPIASCDRPDCKPGDNVYTSGADSLVQTYTLGNRMTISDFCALSGGSWSCGLSSLDIVFSRPNPDALISANGLSYSSACITVTSPQGGMKYVSIAASGQINADASSCP